MLSDERETMKESEVSKAESDRGKNPRPVYLDPLAWVGVVLLGGGGLVALFLDEGPQRYLQSYLLGFSYYLSVALGALFFVLVTHLTRAGWSVTVRRMAENLAACLWLAPLLFIPIIVGLGHLYVWAQPGAFEHDALLQQKEVYLNPFFFLVRWIFYFGVWIFLAHYFYRASGQQDETGDPELTLKMERLSAPGMMVYSLTITFASFDLLMSLDAHWFSTIFGVYFFSSSVVSFFALLALRAASLCTYSMRFVWPDLPCCLWQPLGWPWAAGRSSPRRTRGLQRPWPSRT